jgi:molybdopterin/thiamine biosynthesis adenylyltransferase
VTVKTYRERLTSENADRILGEGWDVIVDGADNFPTRYLLNDASVWHGIPVVHGSIYRFEGQVTVFSRKRGRAIGASFPIRRRRSSRRRARKAACSVCCRA